MVDFCGYDPANYDINGLSYQDVFTERLVGKGTSHGLARRIIIPLSESNKSESVYCNLKVLNIKHSLEFPIINYSKYNTLPYKYAYACNFFYKKPFSIVKINVDDPEESWEHEYELPTEPAFVESPNAKKEDDGILLVMVQSKKGDYLSILNANDMTEIARATLPEDMPAESRGGFAFHGFFADTENFKGDFN